MASGPSRTLTLRYASDTSRFSKGNKQATSSLQKLGKSFSKFGKLAAGGAAVAGVAAVALGKKLFEAGEAASTANSRIANIADTLGIFGDEAGDVSGRLVALAESQAKLTGISRNTIKETSALLLTFKGVAASADEAGGVFDRAQQAALDLAAAGFGNATTNAQSLGKALEDPVRGLTALTRQGVTFTDEERERIKVLQESNRLGEAQEIVLAAIEGQVAGTAEATANSSEKLRESFGILVDQIAGNLAPVFEKLTEVAQRVIDRLVELWDIHGPAIIEFVERARERFAELVDQFRQNVVPVLRDVIDRVIEFVAAIREWWQRVSPGVLDSFRRLKQPIVDLWTNIKEAFQSVRDLISSFRTGESDGKGFERFIERLVGVFEFLLKVVNFVVRAIGRLADAIRRVTSSKPFQALISGIGAIGSGIGGIISKIPGLAEGGIVTRPTLAMVGEGGEPEAVIPLSKMGQMGGGVNITINGALDPEGVARQIRRILDDSQRRTGASLTFA